jgi:hypothetical protein
MQRYILLKCDRWFKSKISLLLMMKKVVKNERLSIFLVQANDVKEAFDNTMGIMQSTMGEYSIPFRNPYGCFSVFFWRRGRFGKIEKFNALKS